MTIIIDDEKERILTLLGNESSSVSISQIAKKTGINRHTVARHLDVLEILGKVRKLEKGVAKKYVLVPTLPVSGLIDISSDLILILNSHLVVQYLNNSAIRYFKRPVTGIIGNKLETLHLPLVSDGDVLKALHNFTFEKSDLVTVKDEAGRWFEIMILGFSLPHISNQIAIICTDITEKKLSEEELRMAHEKYACAFHASPDGIIMSDLESGEIIEVNPSFCQITGFSCKELVGKTTFGLWILESEECRNQLIEKVKNRISTNQSFEYKLQKKTGEIIDVSLSSSIIRTNNRECLLSLMRDISGKKTGEEKIRKSEEQYRILAENTQDVIWIMEYRSSCLTYVSPSVERLLGMTPETFLRQKIEDMVTGESHSRAVMHIENCIREMEPGERSLYSDIRMDFIRSDGVIAPTEASITIIRDSAGNPVRILGVSRDISHRLEMEKRLKESEFRFRLLTESIRDVVWVMDPDTRICTYVSPSVIPLLGYSPDEICNHRIDPGLPPSVRGVFIARCRDRYEEFLRTRDQFQYYADEYPLIRKTGEEIWVEIVTHFTHNRNTGGIDVIGVTRDITRDKEVYMNLQEREAQYRLMNENIRDIIWLLDPVSEAFMYVSPTLHTLRGYHPDEIVGRSYGDLMSSDLFMYCRSELQRKVKAFESGDESLRHGRITLPLRHRNGDLIPVEISTSFVTGPDGKVSHIIGISRDIVGKTEKN